MSTKELIEAEIQHLDESQLNEVYAVVRRLAEAKKRATAPTLMSKLKQIEIDAPEDFAANLDLYTSGEKCVE